MHRMLIASLLGAAALAQQAQAPKNARVVGRLVSQSGDPVRRATVKLLGTVTYTQTSDDNGLFLLESVEPGSYALVAVRIGFSPQKYGAATPLTRDCENLDTITEDSPNPVGLANARRCIARAPGTTLSLTAGQEMKDLVIQLTRQGVINGKVTDQDGEVLARWQVQALKVVYERGVRRLQNVSNVANTDPDGNYAIDYLPPGRYYLFAANTIANLFSGLSQGRQGKALPEADVSTYYPSAPGALKAAPVEVEPGADLRGIDIQVRRARVFSIRGKVAVPANAGPPSDQILTLAPKGEAAALMNLKQAGVKADGAFEFRDVEPGEYVLYCGQTGYGNPGAAPRLFARQEVTVSFQEVEGIAMSPTSGLEVTGTVTVEGRKAGTWPSIWLLDTEGAWSTGMPDFDSNGKFRLTLGRAGPARYAVSVTALPAGTYVKSIRYGNQDALHALLDLTVGSSGSLDIVLSFRVAAITGSVKNAKDETVSGIVVSAWPRKPEVRGGVKSASTDQNGNFEIPDLGPGDYFVAAWADIDPGLLEAPEFLARFHDAALAVKLDEGGSANADLRLISRERIAAGVENLP